MNDQFLHQLRRQPPADFAIRLKWQLDRPVPMRRFKSRLILGLAIFGTAFALVSPPGRRALGDWFATTTTPAQTAPRERSLPPRSASSAGMSAKPMASPRAAQPHYRSAVPEFDAPQSTPAPAAPEEQAATNAAQPAAMPAAVPVVVAGVPQTPEMQAASAVSLRRGLFLNLGFVMQRLNSMLQRGAPVDMGVIRTGAIRLQTLSAMIPELFHKDTRAFESNTRALEGIWRNPQEFAAKADDLTQATDALAAAAAANDDDAALRAIGRIAAACTACHDVYRAK
jgi:cytochrome c556